MRGTPRAQYIAQGRTHLSHRVTHCHSLRTSTALNDGLTFGCARTAKSRKHRSICTRKIESIVSSDVSASTLAESWVSAAACPPRGDSNRWSCQRRSGERDGGVEGWWSGMYDDKCDEVDCSGDGRLCGADLGDAQLRSTAER